MQNEARRDSVMQNVYKQHMICSSVTTEMVISTVFITVNYKYSYSFKLASYISVNPYSMWVIATKKKNKGLENFLHCIC